MLVTLKMQEGSCKKKVDLIGSSIVCWGAAPLACDGRSGMTDGCFRTRKRESGIKGDMKVRVKTRLEAQAGALQMATDDASLPWLP